jgi:hypothetical protein
VIGVYLQRPGQIGRAAEELLVEVVADAPDGLRDQQRRRGCVKEAGEGCAGAVHAPKADEGAQRDAAPDTQSAPPDGSQARRRRTRSTTAPAIRVIATMPVPTPKTAPIVARAASSGKAAQQTTAKAAIPTAARPPSAAVSVGR